MKKFASLLLITFAVSLLAQAADKARPEGPKGGRLLEKSQPQAEFYLETNRTASIWFYDRDLKAQPAGSQQATLIADTAKGKEKIEFEKKGDALVSKGKLPEGDGYNVVLQLRSVPDARPQNYRFKLETYVCGGCNRQEYACTCHE